LLTSRKTQKDATDPGTTIGFTYDARGNLLTRQQYLTGQGETFTHDEMGRLTKWESTGGSANWKVEYGYDSIGNLQSREESLNGTSQGVKTFATGYTDACQNTAGPHAVTTVTLGGTTECYGYDARGQQTAGADQRVVAYTEYGLPTQITSNGVQWQFGYDATHRRATKTGPGGSTIYVGSLYEKRVSTGGTKSHVMYVLAGGEVKAQIVVDDTGGGEKIDYLMRDHLGSVTKTGGDGDWQDMRFDPYGSRIAAAPPPTPVADNPSSRVRLGFTGQEEDDDLALVNMNGRIYDPALARFLTPDPLVSMRSPSQSWNRYSYAENSPLRFVDPSGFDGEDMSSGGGWPMAGYPPGTYTPMYSPSGSYLASGGFSGSYGTITVGPPVLSGDEAGAGASSAEAAANITQGMIRLQQQLEGGDIQARGWEAASAADYASAIADMRESGELGGVARDADGNPIMVADASGVVVQLLKNGGTRVIRTVEQAEAVAARRAGENVLMETRQAAKAVERAASGGSGELLRDEGHELANGKAGLPHYQTEGMYGHTFWGKLTMFSVAVWEVIKESLHPAALLDPAGAIRGQLGCDVGEQCVRSPGL
jgi:RHS repeat-associated protein